MLQEQSADGAWRPSGTVARAGAAHRSSRTRAPPSASSLPGTSGTSVPVAVAPRVQVQALSPRLLAGEVSPRPDASVAVWRLVRGQWRVVAHPILDSSGKFRTPLPLRPVDYRITVAAGKLAATQTSLHVTRRLLQSLAALTHQRPAERRSQDQAA